MNSKDVKIKYIIGSFKESEDYPTVEDFEYLILNWYYNEGGLEFTHEYRTVEKTGNPCFPENILTEKLNGDEELTKRLLKSYSEEGRVQVVKKTRFTDYYEIIKTGS
tara:strand:+ start:490 stop:810 length:321 start_codon:yes stop_codon:yes gene_type:complete